MSPPDSADPGRRWVGPVLGVAILAVSAAGVLVRLADGVHPVVMALWRCSIVGMLLAPTALGPLLRGRGLGLRGVGLSGRDLALTGLAGLLLALHFSIWFASLQLTTVMRSTVLVCLNPVWTGLLEWALTRRRPANSTWIGIGLAVAGVGVMATGSRGTGTQSGVGDALALVAGMLAAGYLVVGRSVRQRVGIGPYGTLICTAAALWLLPAALLIQVPIVGFTPRAWLALLALALGPQLLGHIGFNYAVRYVSAAVVATVILLEPVGGTALAALVLHELPGRAEIVGGLVVLVGVAIAARR